jgi:hypothetical protein
LTSSSFNTGRGPARQCAEEAWFQHQALPASNPGVDLGLEPPRTSRRNTPPLWKSPRPLKAPSGGAAQTGAPFALWLANYGVRNCRRCASASDGFDAAKCRRPTASMTVGRCPFSLCMHSVSPCRVVDRISDRYLVDSHGGYCVTRNRITPIRDASLRYSR